MKLSLPTLFLAAFAMSSSLSAQALVFDDARSRLPGREGRGQAGTLADVDGDGLLDVIRATAEGLDVLRQDRAGGFQRGRGPIALGLPPTAAVVSLCTGKLRPGAVLPDIVVGVTGADSLLFRNDGSGGFAQQVPSPLPRPVGFNGATTQVLVADLDGVVGDDVLVLHDGAQPQLFLLQATGGFVDRGRGYFPAGFLPQSPAAVVSDFTGDGLLDLVLIRRALNALPILLVSQAGARFSVSVGAFSTTPFPATVIAAGDVTRDGVADVVLGTAVAAGSGVVVLANNGRGAFAAGPAVGFSTGGVRDLAIGPLDGVLQNDLVVLQADGQVGVSLARNGSYGSLTSALPRGSRQALVLGDLEADGDADLYVLGSDLEDGLLLGDGSGDFLATEEVTMPATVLANHALVALVDATGEGDPDVIGFDSRGDPISLVNDGSARFRQSPGLVPSFASVVRDVAPLAAAGPGSADLLVLGSRSGVARIGIHVLVRQGGRLTDETASRWPNSIALGIAAMAAADMVRGTVATTGYDDVVAVDDSGGLLLFVNQGGVFSVQPAFGFGTVSGAVQVLLGRVDADPWLDVVVLRQNAPPAVFLRQPAGSYRAIPQPNLGPIQARQGVLADATGDGITDLLVVARSSTASLLLLQGAGDGTFVDRSGQAPGPPPAGLTSVTALGGPLPWRPDALVLSSDREPDVLLVRQGALWSSPQRLPCRGSRATERVLVGDVDVDGDPDLVMVRSSSLPRVLFHQRLQLQSLGVAQLGRPALVRLTAPHLGVAALFVGPRAARLPLPPFGLLRLDPVGLAELLQFPVPASGVVDVSLLTSAAWPEFELPMQVGYLDAIANELVFSNLEHLTFVRR